MIQRWKREKSAGDQTALQVHFLFVFHEIPDDDFYQTDVMRTTYPKISMIQRFIPEIWPPEHYWFSPKSAALSPYPLFSIIFLLVASLQFYRHLFFHNYNFVPLSCFHVFYFIFHVNYLVYFCLNR
jgi:hypothetical protein